MNLTRMSLIGTVALVASLSGPLALAQSQSDTTTTDAAAMQSPPPLEPITTNDAAASMQSNPAKLSWSDLDADHSGSLSRAEASASPSLGKAFDRADSNADGALSADEYKAYVAMAGQKGKP
jgi:hypothetical protein